VVSDETFRVWDLDSRKMVAECKCGVVQALSSDGRYVAAFEYQTPSARVLDTANGNEMARITGGGIIFAGAFSPKDSNLALVTLNGADVWEAPAGKSTLTIIRSGPDAIYTEFGENEEHLITLIRSANGLSASKWQSLSGQNISSIALNDASEPVTVSADHRYIATAAPGGIRRLDITNGEQRSLNYKGAAAAIALSPDGLFVSVAIDRKISLTDFASSSQEQVQLTAPGTVRLLAVGDGGKLVVAVSIGRAERAGDPVFGTLWQPPSWDPKTFRVGRDLSGFDAKVCGLSLDGPYVAVNFGDKIGIQDVKDGHRVVNFFGAVGDLCAFSGDGRLFASSSGDAVHLWDMKSGDEFARIEYVGKLKNITLSPHGKYLATTDEAGLVRVWRLEHQVLVEEACSRLTRNLTPEEWKDLLGDEPYRAPACSVLGAVAKH